MKTALPRLTILPLARLPRATTLAFSGGRAAVAAMLLNLDYTRVENKNRRPTARYCLFKLGEKTATSLQTLKV